MGRLPEMEVGHFVPVEIKEFVEKMDTNMRMVRQATLLIPVK
jgi:hypothetical protein